MGTAEIAAAGRVRLNLVVGKKSVSVEIPATGSADTWKTLELATILGMNVDHGLEDRPLIVFIAVLIIGLGIGLCVKSWVARKPS